MLSKTTLTSCVLVAISFTVIIAPVSADIMKPKPHSSPVEPIKLDHMRYKGLGLSAKVKIHAPGTLADNRHVKVGQMKLNYQKTNYLGYCVDLNHYAGSCYVSERPVESLNNGNLVAYLFETYSETVLPLPVSLHDKLPKKSVVGNIQAAALQCAIWEVINETSADFSLSHGDFGISQNYVVRTMGNHMLDSMSNTYNPENVLLVLHNDCKQDMLIGTNVPVPEPVTASVLMVGGILLLVRRKRRMASDR